MIQDFTEAVFRRPAMYTLTGSYPEVVAFLEGYYSGLAKSPNGAVISANWSSFREWLAEELEVSPPQEFQTLHDSYQSDALEVLKQFYERFKSLQG
jgi:hypothetical protein